MLKKIFYILISVVFVLYLAGCMFYCFICGAPMDRGSLLRYVFYTGMFSILVPAFLCGCLYYIHYLHKIIDKMYKV